MPEFQTVRFSEASPGLFSPVEIEEMMRVEFDRAERHQFPLVCTMIAIDRLGQLQDLYGYESRDEILRAVISMLRESLRDSDHLGMTADERFLAVFPHTTPETGALLAKRLLGNARKLRFERDGRSLRISLSIGIAHNRADGASSFETLLGVAEEGLIVADAGGGDRYVETELYHLYEKKRANGKRPRFSEAPASTTPAASTSPYARAPAHTPAPVPALHAPSREELFGRALIDVLVSQGHDAKLVAALTPDQIAALIKGLRDKREVAIAVGGESKDREIELLQRRIEKLSGVLGATEEELRRVAALKGIDIGVASIYKTVQGLSADAAQYQRKREMMKTIFEANFALKKELESG
jgi:diguanylate cyclase (GGDEF)-like protein